MYESLNDLKQVKILEWGDRLFVADANDKDGYSQLIPLSLMPAKLMEYINSVRDHFMPKQPTSSFAAEALAAE